MRRTLASWLRRWADRLDRRWDGTPDSWQLRAAAESIQLRAWSSAVTLRVARIRENRESSYNTGSGVLMQFGARAVVATAWHVLEEFRQSRESGQEVVLICDQVALVNPRTVYRDERSDLAFIEIPPAGYAGVHAVPYRPGLSWPPPHVDVGDSVLLCGFPKRFRFDGEAILHGDLNLMTEVAAVGESHFMLNIDWSRMADAGRIAVPKAQVNDGGVSGGPVFRWDSGANPLVGVVVEAGEDLPIWRIASFAGLPADFETRGSNTL